MVEWEGDCEVVFWWPKTRLQKFGKILCGVPRPKVVGCSVFLFFSVVLKRLEMPLFTDVFENIDVKYFLFHFYD